MKLGIIFRMLGAMLIFLSVAMFSCLLVALFYRENIFPFLYAISLTLAVGSFLRYFFRKANEEEISHLEGFAIAALTWFLASLFAGLPAYFAHIFDGGLIDAYFESVSGFTGTGSTVLRDIEAVPKGILFWRALTQWLGGMGMIVLAVALLPSMSLGGMRLFRAEVPGPTKEKIAPRIKDTAKILWGVYTLLTLMETLLLVTGGMTFYEALTHSLTTLPTGGYSIKNNSIAAYDSPFLQWVIIIFMFLGGVNFTLHYVAIIRGKLLSYARDSEFWFYTFIILTASLSISVSLYFGNYFNRDISEIFRQAVFQVVSMMTTTGYASADFDIWPDFTKILLIFLPIVGGCVGSTGGGFKVMRIMLLIKYAYNSIVERIYPKAVNIVKINGSPVLKEILSEINSLFFMGITFIFGATLLISAIEPNIDILTSFTAAITTTFGVGPGLNMVGPTQNFSFFSPLSKFIFSSLMILGRLEFFSVLVFLVALFKKVKKIK